MKTTNSITFESWTAMDSERQLTEPERKRMSGPWRVWEISLARVNNWGHAPFAPGELVTLACGADSPSNRAQVHRWMKTLGDMGRIDRQSSTPLCVMVNRDVAQRQSGRGKRQDLCWEPEHNDKRETPYMPSLLNPRFAAPEAPADPWEDSESEAHTYDSEPAAYVSEPHTQPSWRQYINSD